MKVATPFFDPYVVPLAVAILIGIFAIQQHGTHRVGRLFGPVMVLWFVTIAILGLTWIVRKPVVLSAINPAHAVVFFETHGMHGFAVLGAVFLAVTGGEALYADMGHFGKRPIRFAWFALVLPALLINYFGQGALLLIDSTAAEQPFFLLAPSWALLPMVGLATAAAIIASQALISGAFSLTHQAVQLGYSPRMDIDHTSSHHMGQIYVPQVNWALMVGTIAIVLGFRSSSALAAAYGIAVTLTMVITAVLLHVIATERWKWPLGVALLVTGVFLSIDLAFFGANLLKVAHGGWLPLVIGTVLFTMMTTWKTGRRLVAERLTARALPLEEFVAATVAHEPIRVPGTAVFMTAQPRGTPPALVHNLRHNKVLHRAGHHPQGRDDAHAARHAGRTSLGCAARPRSVQRRVALWVHGRAECPRGAGARTRAGPGDRCCGRHLLSRPRDGDRHEDSRDGDVAGEVVRADGQERDSRHRLLQAAARQRRRARRAGRNLTVEIWRFDIRGTPRVTF